MLLLQSLHGTTMLYINYAPCSRKYITTSEVIWSRLKSHAAVQVKSSRVECDQVDGGRLGVILVSCRVTFLYRSDSQVYKQCVVRVGLFLYCALFLMCPNYFYTHTHTHYNVLHFATIAFMIYLWVRLRQQGLANYRHMTAVPWSQP